MRSTSPEPAISQSSGGPERLLLPTEAAEILAVRPSWVYDAVRARRLPCVRVGRHIRFTRAMLEQWMTEHTST